MNLFRREARIARLCRQSGWLLHGRNLDLFQISAGATSRGHTILVRDDGGSTVDFHSWFPVRFALDNPPSGLFGRLLLRSHDLEYASWSMSIQQSCEAALMVAARVPSHALDVPLFDRVCREITGEVVGFHQELRDKFRYEAGFPPSHRAPVRPEPCPAPMPSWVERLRQLP